MDVNVMKGLEDIGAVGLLFMAYVLLHRQTFKILQDMLASMNDNFKDALAEQKNTVHNVIESFDRMSARQRESEERNYEVLKSLSEDIKVLVGTIGRVEMKVDNLETHIDRRLK